MVIDYIRHSIYCDDHERLTREFFKLECVSGTMLCKTSGDLMVDFVVHYRNPYDPEYTLQARSAIERVFAAYDSFRAIKAA